MTFAELWLVHGLLEHKTHPDRRLALQAGAVETAIGNVFETAVQPQAERDCYRLKTEGLTLSVERLNEVWGEQFRADFGDSVEGEEVVSRWALMPHAIVYRFYLYNYSFSCLIALALMRRLRDDPQRFAARYLDYLDRGGNGTPAEVLAPLGIDLTATPAQAGRRVGDPEFGSAAGRLLRTCRLWRAPQALRPGVGLGARWTHFTRLRAGLSSSSVK